MHFHAQNLNEKPNGKNGSILRHGRCWWHFGSPGPKIGVEWQAFSGDFRIGLSFGEAYERTVGFSLGCGLFSLWVTVDGFVGSWLPRNRDCNIYWFEKALWVHPWSRRFEWRGRDPWWIRGFSIHFDDLLLGRPKYSEEVISEHDVLIPMPEGSYPAKVKMERHTWRRPRWFATGGLYANVDIPGGIPFEGKGENSWDCGEDGLFGSSMPVASLEDAVGKTVASVLKSRRKYGNVRNLPPVMSPRVKPPEPDAQA